MRQPKEDRKVIGKRAIENIFDFILSRKRRLGIQAIIHSEYSLLTRFANSTIHQNVQEKNTSVSITVFMGRKRGTAHTNSEKKNDIARILEEAVTIAKYNPPDPQMCGLPPPRTYKDPGTYFPSTAHLSHRKKATLLKSMFERCDPYHCFGAFTTGTTEIAIANTRGLFAYNKGTDAILRLTIKGKNGSAFGQCAHRDANELDYNLLLRDVHTRARKAQNPREPQPGRYTVLLSPEAVSDILVFLGFLGFNALLYSEGQSPLQGKIGKRIFSRALHILDDPSDERGFAFPFDFEGTPKKKLVLVAHGMVKSLVHDRKTARRMKTRSTGHHTGAGSGPFPMNMVLGAGNKTADDLRKNIKRGIEISSLHYVNVVEPHTLTLTGMTRNGTFMIEDGARAYPLRNMRFNQSMLASLNSIEAIASAPRLIEGGNTYGERFPWGYILPSLVIGDFNFTGKTEF
jgi:PmbA protein